MRNFPSRVELSSYFGLETSILARGRAGSNRAVLTAAGWSAHGESPADPALEGLLTEVLRRLCAVVPNRRP